MIITPEIKKIYSEIQKKILYMIPEKWDKIYLYASVIENMNSIETGEMFFYYFPKGILKKNPINVYEIPEKFNIEEQEYMELAENLYDTIKRLREEFRKSEKRVWSNITISIENFKFNIEFNYENMLNSKYSNYDRQIVWKYKYLNEPMEKLNKKDRKMLEDYLIEENLMTDDTCNYEENLYSKDIHNVIEYNKDIKEENNYDQQEMQKILNKYEIKEKKQEKRQMKKGLKKEEIANGKNQILNL